MEKQLRIRPVALCLIQKDDAILVEECFDEVSGQTFFRPLGGGIELGEPAAEAVVRELQEEIGEKICGVRQAGIFENIFTFRGRLHHEVVFLFQAEFENPAAYEKLQFEVVENYGTSIASWQAVADFEQNKQTLLPKGVKDFLSSYFESDEISDEEWLKAVSSNPVFDFLKDPAEDIYTIANGKPWNQE